MPLSDHSSLQTKPLSFCPRPQIAARFPMLQVLVLTVAVLLLEQGAGMSFSMGKSGPEPSCPSHQPWAFQPLPHCWPWNKSKGELGSQAPSAQPHPIPAHLQTSHWIHTIQCGICSSHHDETLLLSRFWNQGWVFVRACVRTGGMRDALVCWHCLAQPLSTTATAISAFWTQSYFLSCCRLCLVCITC